MILAGLPLLPLNACVPQPQPTSGSANALLAATLRIIPPRISTLIFIRSPPRQAGSTARSGLIRKQFPKLSTRFSLPDRDDRLDRRASARRWPVSLDRRRFAH